MKKKIKRAMAVVICILMVLSVIPLNTLAAESNVNSLTVASRTTSQLAPGVTETAVVSYDKNGDRVKYWVVNANVADVDTVQIKANYHDNDNTGNWGKATVVEQAEAATAKRGYNVVVSQNAAYYNVGTGQPSGAFVMEGVNINGNSMGNQYEFFAQLDDGSYMIGKKNTFSQYSEHITEAFAGHLLLVWDGKVVDGLNATSKYPRSTIGLTADGNVVTVLADGNQKPASAGLTYAEQAQLMLDLGCVSAIELDGGGSATYASKYEGEDKLTVRNNCCDGTVRSVSNTFMIISTAVPDGTFDHANLSTDYAYYVPNSAVKINASGADASGHAADLPEDITWSLSDDDFGTVKDGVFQSNGKVGTVTVNMKYNGAVVGSIDVTIVVPTSVSFSSGEKTVPYGKAADMTVSVIYNGAEVYADATAFDFSYTVGTMEGYIFTAPAEESGVMATEIIATYKYADGLVARVAITFGKGSDVLFDFEDGDASKWGTLEDLMAAAESGEYTKGYTNVRDSSQENSIDQGAKEAVSLVTAETGKVHSGDYALAYTFDYRQSTEYCSWLYGYLYYWGDRITYRDIEKGINGTRLGMWMYIPQEAVGSCSRLSYNYVTAAGTKSTSYLYFDYDYVEKGFSKLASEVIPEAGWAYVSVNLDNISKTFVSTAEYGYRNAASDYAPAFIQWIISSSATGAEKCTFYIDDITLDYSDAVDDRDAPSITGITYADTSMTDAAPLNGQTTEYSKVDFAATVMEDTVHNPSGIDASTAAVYVDGQKIDSTYTALSSNNGIFAASAVLPNGTHDITFEIADNFGNYVKTTKQITIANPTSTYPSVVVKGERLNGTAPIKCGEQYNINITTDKAEAIDTLTTTIWLNSASTWVLEHMTVAQGFKADYTLDDIACKTTITLTNENSTLSGNATLVTIPVYNFFYDGSSGVDAHTQWETNNYAPILTLSWDVQYGAVTYTDGNSVAAANYVAGFGNGRVNEETELNSSIANLKKTIGEWHYHTEAAIDDKEATCTEGGYYGRTVCTDCHSIIDWGTTVSALGHNYVGGVCSVCDEKLTGTDSTGHYYIDGVIANGWVNDVYYYVDGIMLTGVKQVGEYYYNFGEDGICEGQTKYTGLFEMDGARYYAINGSLVKNTWIQVDDAWYCFRSDYKAYTGDFMISGRLYHFGETGAIIEGQWFDVDGYHRYYFGPNYYFGPWGLTIKVINGVEYGFDEHGDIKRGYCYNILAAGDPKRLYLFDDNGVRLPVPTEPTIITLDGKYRYINNAEIQANAGLVCIDGDYYFVRGSGDLATGTYYIEESRSNGLGYIGYFDFDETGKMILKNGIIDGHYYVDGAMQLNLGLIKVGDDYYFVRGNGDLATGKFYVEQSRSNGLGYVGYFDFDETGKMILKNGIIDGHYYVDGAMQLNLGLIKVGDDYYFVRGNGDLATGKFYVEQSRSNGLGYVGYFDFDETGKMILKNGIIDGHYYVDGAMQLNLGLIKVGDDYYFVRGNGDLATGKFYVEQSRSNGLGYVGYFDFDETGKMILKNGIIDGHYYVDGAMQLNLGLIKVGDDYYFVRGNGNLATGKFYVEESRNNGYGFVGNYMFDETGKMIL